MAGAKAPSRGIGVPPATGPGFPRLYPDSTTTPRTPESNGRSQPGPTGPQVSRRAGGSKHVGSIGMKPDVMPPHGVPDLGNLESKHPGPEAGRGQGGRR